jgi:hypothetical protein
MKKHCFSFARDTAIMKKNIKLRALRGEWGAKRLLAICL